MREIELCQEHLNTSYNRAWQSGAIILAGALASLALMLQIDASDTAAAAITTIFAVGAILAVALWLVFVQRETAFQRVSIRRASELERDLGMRRGALIRELDEMIEQGTGICESSDLSVEERRLLENIYRTSYRRRIPLITPPGTSDTLFRIGFIVIMGWLLVTAWRWLIVVDAFPQRDDSICITIEAEDKDGVSANEC